MELKVIRSVFSAANTLGKMYINDEFFAYTLEDTDRHLKGDCSKKIKNQTCIDQGNYEVVLNHSNHFDKLLPELLNVHCFGGVRIHGGNTNADTDGCILIGENSNMEDRIWNCAIKVEELIEKIQTVSAGEKVMLEITELVLA